MKISTKEIDLLAKYIFKISGIKLDQSKGYLLENRLKPLLRAEGIVSFRALQQHAVADPSGRLQTAIIDAISTNETYFFRDNTPFELLKNKIIPDIIDRRRKTNPSGPVSLRIWSAACSTGQEVYSIAITLLEMLPDRNRFDISIVGTDISDKAVTQASYGKYNKFEVERGLHAQKRQKYFVSSGANWRIKDEVRSLVKFEKLNLMQPFPNFGKFDIVLCRNVAIYFNNADKVKLFQKIGRVMRPDGALIVGGSENLAAIAPDFVSRNYLRGIYYQLKSSGRPEKQDVSPKPVTAGRKKAVIPVKSRPRKTVYDRVKKKKEPKKDKPLTGPDRVIKEKVKPAENVRTDAAAADKPVDIGRVAETTESREPVTLSEKLAGKQAGAKKESMLSALRNKKQSSSSLLGARQQQSSNQKSLLGGITRQSKKKGNG